jgi:hypothetical protein
MPSTFKYRTSEMGNGPGKRKFKEPKIPGRHQQRLLKSKKQLVQKRVPISAPPAF